jgi:hypothetical protein
MSKTNNHGDKEVNRIYAIFSDPLNVWGLMGEPQLWEEFRKHFEDRTPPSTEEKLLEELHATFEKLTGKSVKSKSFIYINRYSSDGITSGMVDPWNWRAIVIPALARRYREFVDTR